MKEEITGIWNGYYKHESDIVPAKILSQKISFKITITNYNENKFLGMVEDDLSTGGTEGIGIITGRTNGSAISFVKQMPILTALMSDGNRKIFNRKHKKIYYEGTFLEDEKKYKGTWKFKWGIVWNGLIPFIIVPINGIWEMTKELYNNETVSS